MTKISDLTALTGAGVDTAADLLPIVDMSEAGAARNKKITIDEARIGLGLGTAASPQFTGVNLGHASDTTITRASAGVIAVEGVNVMTVGGGTFTGDIIVPDEAYDATNWNGSLEVPTKNAVRDKIEALGTAGAITAKDEGSTLTAAVTSIDFVGAGVTATNTGGDVTVTIAGGGGYNAENARDDIGAALVAGTGVSITVNDGADTITIAAADLGAFHLQDQRASGTGGGTFTSGAWQPRVLNTEVINTITSAVHITSTVTITIASPGVVSWTAHGLVAGTPVIFSTTGALPTGLTAGTVYYVLAPNANDFTVSATSGGAAINTTGSQSGTHTAKSNQFTLPAGTYDITASAPCHGGNNHQIRLQNLTDASTTLVGVTAYARSTSGSTSNTHSLLNGRFVIAGTKRFEIQHQCETTLATTGMGVGAGNTWGNVIFAGVFIKRVA